MNYLLLCVVGYGSMLFIPRWQSRRDTKEVQRHHQDIPFHAHRCSVCTFWWRPKSM